MTSWSDYTVLTAGGFLYNTKEAIHYYFKGPLTYKHCNITDDFTFCVNCFAKCCMICNVCEIEGKKYCSDCIDDILYKMLFKSISSAFDSDISYQILECITDYSFGTLVKCCNISCNKSIVFNNEFEFRENVDFEGNWIHKYVINPKLFHKNAKYPTVDLYKTKYRIFCARCTLDHYLRTKNTNAYVIEFSQCEVKRCQTREVESVCLNHGVCTVCKVWPNKDRKKYECIQCKILYCSKCGSSKGFCKKCDILKQFRRYSGPIHSVLTQFGNDIINNIVQFCIGFEVQCCFKECKNKILFLNRTDFENGIDCNGNALYQWQFPFKQKLEREFDLLCIDLRSDKFRIHNLFGKYVRVFCAQCTETRIDKCNFNFLIKQQRRDDRNYLSIGMKYNSSIETMSDYYSGDYRYYRRCTSYNYDSEEWYWEFYLDGQSGDWFCDLALRYNKEKRGRKYGKMCRKEKKNIEFCKEAMLKSKNAQKKKNFWKRKDDKYSNAISKKKFKKRCLLQLQY